jgi:predicted amidohydrolase YtcJ
MVVDRILYNGNIYTQNASQPRVQALAIIGENIVAAGGNEEILALASARTQKHDLQGYSVIPGLTDAHVHFQWLSISLHSVDVYEIPTREEAVQRVAARVSQTQAGKWIFGSGWTQDFWPDRQFPSAADLDAVAKEHPVFLQAKSGHAAWVNSVALREAGITASTPDPEGGQIVRDSSGQPTGLLFEDAMKMVSKLIPAPTPEELVTMMRHTQNRALAYGMTGFHDYDNPSCLVALQMLREQGDLALRVVKHINQAWLDHALALGIRGGFGDEWIRIGCLKMFADGALGPRTALMVEPYEGEPDNYGIVVVDKETMYAAASRASAAGLPTTIHAIGDKAVHDVLDIFEAVRKEETARGETPSQRRHRIEHVQVIHPEDKHRLAELQIIASMQPIHATSDMHMADSYWGKRSQWAYNTRLQRDQGVVLSFGSDAPVEHFDPLWGIHAAVTRRRRDGTPGPEGWYPELRLTMQEALEGYTLGPAYAAGLENRLGRLAPGYLADLVVIDRDLPTLPGDEILQTGIQATMVGGQWRYGDI